MVDTSVWIDFFRGAPTTENALLKDCLNRREHLFVTGVVVQEILQGIRDDSQYLAVKGYLFLLPRVDVEFADHVEAASVYRNLRKKGLTIDSPVDCLIAVLALRHDLALLHRDSDFTLISHHHPLRILR